MARLVNEEAVRLAERHPGRFGFFASLPAPESRRASKNCVTHWTC
jgi:hypothetical protein